MQYLVNVLTLIKIYLKLRYSYISNLLIFMTDSEFLKIFCEWCSSNTLALSSVEVNQKWDSYFKEENCESVINLYTIFV